MATDRLSHCGGNPPDVFVLGGAITTPRAYFVMLQLGNLLRKRAVASVTLVDDFTLEMSAANIVSDLVEEGSEDRLRVFRQWPSDKFLQLGAQVGLAKRLAFPMLSPTVSRHKGEKWVVVCFRQVLPIS